MRSALKLFVLLRAAEFILGAIALTVCFFFSAEPIVPAFAGNARIVGSVQSAVVDIILYYFLFGDFYLAAFGFWILWLAERLRPSYLAAVNAVCYAAPAVLLYFSVPPLGRQSPIWIVTIFVTALDFVLPLILLKQLSKPSTLSVVRDRII